MKAVFIFCLCFLCGEAFTQNARLKIYAFKQAVVTGVKPSYEMDEKGKPVVLNEKGSFNYFIYSTTKPSGKISFVAIWLQGEEFNLKTEAVIQTPVVLELGIDPFSNKKIELVPATKRKVWRLTPMEKIPRKFPIKLDQIIRTHELVIVYTWKRKTRFALVKEIKNLPVGLKE